MNWLILGLAILIGIHLVPAMPARRQQLIRKLGDRFYQAMFAFIALVGLVFIIVGMGRIPFIAVWEPPSWGDAVVPWFMLPACILLVAAYLPGNIHRVTRHPMLWGVVLWAIGHMLANGDVAGLLLFGSLGIYSLFAMWSANQRGAEKATIRISFGRDLIVVGIGVVLYVALVFLHPTLFGVAAISGV